MKNIQNHILLKSLGVPSILRIIPAVLILAIIANSCKKEPLTQHNSKREGGIDQVSVQIIEGRLYFPTLESLDSTLEFMGTFEDSDFLDWDEYYSYASWRESIEYDDSQIPDEDKIIGTLFNENQLLQVGDWVLKISTNNLLATTLSAFQESGEFVWEEPETLTFTEDQDIWDELFPEENTIVSGCNESSMASQYESNGWMLGNAESKEHGMLSYGLVIGIRYQKAYWGVYKRLKYGGAVVFQHPGTSLIDGVYGSYCPEENYSISCSDLTAKFKQKCKDCLAKSRGQINPIACLNPSGMEFQLAETLYCRTRALYYHKTRISFKLTIGDQTYTTNRLTMESYSTSDCTF